MQPGCDVVGARSCCLSGIWCCQPRGGGSTTELQQHRAVLIMDKRSHFMTCGGLNGRDVNAKEVFGRAPAYSLQAPAAS
ncbi:unnamed protein product [Pleuronectes platessa]|uniref:Uncharacterized protein n=1 Tax=Pleuronectes platessa TaxID=8262 RepID=A0A9N7YXM1_PLEPL|nr:unnamed protein product [Pleuronectes platessa]